MATMKAVRVHEYGGPEVLKYEDAPLPVMVEGDVLVRVHAASVNPADWKARAGYLKDYVPYALPMIPGVDLSGTIAEIGPGVSGFAVGDEVYGLTDFVRRDGTYAEYTAVEARRLALKPRSLDHVHAAAVPVAGLAAWHGLLGNGMIALEAGQTVLINGAAGGVGSFAVQFAKWRGATVIGTASARNEKFLRELGVDRFVDYADPRSLEAVGKVDAVLDTVGGEGEARLWDVLKPGGVLATPAGYPSQEQAQAHWVRAVTVMGSDAIADLPKIAALIDEGTIRPITTEVLPLAEARRAHEQSQAGHVRGKIVLKVRD